MHYDLIIPLYCPILSMLFSVLFTLTESWGGEFVLVEGKEEKSNSEEKPGHPDLTIYTNYFPSAPVVRG